MYVSGPQARVLIDSWKKDMFPLLFIDSENLSSSDCTNTLFVEPVSSFIGDPDSGIDGGLLTGIRDNSETTDSGKPNSTHVTGKCTPGALYPACRHCPHYFLSSFILPAFPQQLVNYQRYW